MAGSFLGRQPILDRDQHVVAYELLYRSSATARTAEIDDVGRAVLRVMVNTFASLGVEAVLGRADGFFNVNGEVLLSDAVEALPPDRVVLEILEDVEPTREIECRCRALHEAGYRIALDDWRENDPRERLLPWTEVVKVDLPAFSERGLRRVARVLRRADVLLLAEKVETDEEFRTCQRLGFDRFQGYFFARPIVIEGAEIDPTRLTLIKLLEQIVTEAETDQIVETFKQDAKLGLNLLRLVNSAGRASRVRLESIEDAVRHLGLTQLGRWVTILLYAQGREADLRDPLLTTAAHRARLMELIAARVTAAAGAAPDAERAFLVGMLSLADALLGRPLRLLVDELRLGEELARALTHHEGELGRLLSLAETIERGEVDKFESELAGRDLDLATLHRIELDAYAWVHALSRGA